MLGSGRRSAISTSQLGLYSERVDRLSRSRYGLVARKFAIGVMVVVAVILVAVFLYDFSTATSNGKVNQETKHIYILQNALKKPTNFTRKFIINPTLAERSTTKSDLTPLQPRSDDGSFDPEFRAQNLNNFKLRKRVLKSVDNNVEEQMPQSKQLFDNHALVYRVKQRFSRPELEEENSSEDIRPTPFHWEYRTPQPASFKRFKYPQLTQYRYPHNSRNIQDIIKYLTHDAEMPRRGIKFAGVYVNPKKYDLMPDIGEMMSDSDRTEEDGHHSYHLPLNDDPFYQYKPKHPADVNLLATSNVRFAPSGIHRYYPYYDTVLSRPIFSYNKQPSMTEAQFENPPFMSTNSLKKRKPKPFSVMLDIYPITDLVDQTKKTSRPRPQISVSDDYDSVRSLQFNRGPKFHVPPVQPIPVVGIPSHQGSMDDEERQQMIFHLNLYPRRKNKLSRHEILHKSALMAPAEQQHFMENIMTPLETIAKHLTDHSSIEEFKFEDHENLRPTSLPLTRYQESDLDNDEDKENKGNEEKRPSNSGESLSFEENVTLPENHKTITDDDYASTEKYEIEAQKLIESTTEKNLVDSSTIVTVDESKTEENNSTDFIKNIDTVEGFQQFSDGLLATE